MKSIIANTLIATIVAIIVLFVIVDRKVFCHYDDVQTVQSESSATNRLPSVSVPEVELVTKTTPVEIKLIAETRPITASMPANGSGEIEDRTHAETKPMSETRPTPAAVPIVTQEEAQKMNESAIAYALAEKEKREPFFKFYQDSKLDSVCFQGTIRATSIAPDPEKNDYDNCLYALFLEIDSLLSNVSPDTKIANEVIVNVPILKDKKILKDNLFFPGDRVYCLCADYDAMPQSIQEIQVSDDIQSYEHQQYYALRINQITSFISGGNSNFAKREISILPIQSLAIDETAEKKRSARIQSEIEKIEKELVQHGGSFAAWKEEYKPVGEKYKHLADESYSCWINDAFFAAGGNVDGNESTYNTKDYIESILPYKNYLKKKNIDLIVLRIPTRGDFAARVLASEDFQENPAWVEHYYECLKNDIEIVDPMPEMWKHRFDLPLFYYFTSQDEYHPFEGTYWYASVALGDILKRYQYKKDNLQFEMQRVKTQLNDSRFVYPSGNPKYTSNLEYNQVLLDGEVLENLKSNSGSPFVFLSNSYFGKYLINDLALPIYSACQLQTIPDWYYQQNIGTAMLYNLISSPELLSNRRAVIMIGCSHRGLWGQIHELPKYILDDAKNISLEKTLSLDSPDLIIPDRDKLVFRKNEDGGATIRSNDGLFSFLLSIPKFEEKNVCMIRINFIESKPCSFKTYDVETNTPIESNVKISYGENSHQDLFIPLLNDSRKIRIDFSTSGSQSIRNIELWYY